MKALILAGGLGTRLRSIVNDKPKPMVSFGNMPFLEYQLLFLREHGITSLVFCVGYLYEQIQEYFGDGSQWNVEIDYSVEEKPLGTGGALRHAQRHVHGTFLTLNGDSFFNVNLKQLIQYHANMKAEAVVGRYLGTVALTQAKDTNRYGSVRLDQNSRISRFMEKGAGRPPESGGFSPINAGIYVLEPEILTLVPISRNVSVEQEIFPTILSDGYHLGGCLLEGFFVDIGSPEGYEKFRTYLEEGSQ
ncbi:MAG: nucleotidyltransferase family protein [Candidatus Promineifilaceae bacterium]